ncbi:MAG: hypothetical protein ABGX16_06045 [Pirellulales bacterium]
MPLSTWLHSQTLVLRAQLSKATVGNLAPEEYGADDHWQLTGSANMQVKFNDTHAGVLSLEPLNLAISSIHWSYPGGRRVIPRGQGVIPRGQEDLLTIEENQEIVPGQSVVTVPAERAPVEKDPALWGIWRMRPSVGQPLSENSYTGVVVNRSGVLSIQWQLVETGSSGLKSRDQTATFVLQTPDVVRKTMDLTLPVGTTAEIKPGVVVGTEFQGADFRIWHLELGAATEHELTILFQREGPPPRDGQFSARQTAPSTQPTLFDPQVKLPRVRQSTEYLLSPSGLDLVTNIQIEDHATIAGAMQLRLAKSTEVVSVSIDGRAADWQVVTAEGFHRLHVPLEVGDRLIKVQALLPIVIDELWQLPTIRPLGVYWTQGRASLQIGPRLQLRSLIPLDCTIQQVHSTPGAMGPTNRYDLSESSDRAVLQLIIGKQPTQLKLRVATATSQRDNSLVGHTVAMIRNAGPSQYFVEAEIAPHWKLLSAETKPEDALARWDVYGDRDRQIVRIQFASALTSEESVQIELDGHVITDFDKEKAEVSTMESLRMLKFRNVITERQYLLLQSRPVQQLVGHEEVQDAQVVAGLLSPQDEQLLPDGWQGVLLDLDQLTPSAVIDLAHQQPIYTGDVHVELTVLPDGIEYHYWLECVPTSGAVADITLQFVQEVPDTMAWTVQAIGNSKATEVVAKPGHRAREGEENKQVHLVLTLALSQPFRLEGRYQAPRNSSDETHTQIIPNVISLPEASTTQTWVLFRSALEGWVPHAGESTAVAFPTSYRRKPGDLLPPGDSQTPGVLTQGGSQWLPVLGCFRLAHNGLSQMKGGLSQERGLPTLLTKDFTLEEVSRHSSRSPWFAQFADFSTFYSADGTVLNTMVYHLENQGHLKSHTANPVEVTMPAGTHLQSVWLDARKITPASLANEKNAFRINLASTEGKIQETRTILTIRYVSDQPALAWSTLVEPACPQVDFPVMRGRWTLWTSRRWAVRLTSGGAVWLASSASHVDWKHRLFGPLARLSWVPPFSPLHRNAWMDLWDHFIDRFSSAYQESRVSVEPNITGPRDSELPDSTEISSVISDTPGFARNFEMPGWRSHAVNYVDQPMAMELVNVDTAEARWYLLWLFVAVAGAWKFAKWPRLLLMVIVIAAAICLLVEPHWISTEWNDGPTAKFSGRTISDGGILAGEITSRSNDGKSVSDGSRMLGSVFQAIFLGLLTSLILRGVLHWPGKFRQGRLLTYVVVIVVLGLGESQITIRCHAQGVNVLNAGNGSHKSPERQRNSQDIQRVLIPVNPEGKALTQGEVYVPEMLYRQLFEPSQQSLETAQWVLTAAHYRGSLFEQRFTNKDSQDLDAERRQYVCGDWKLSFDITSYRPHCKWKLPLKQGSAQWFEDECRLDGSPWQIEWLPEDGGCQILLPRPGAHRLEIVLRPRISRQPRLASLRIPVPAIAGATLDLQLPTELTGLAVSHATHIDHSSSAKSIHALLQPVDAIEVGWVPAHRTVDERARWSAKQLTWLKVDPSQTLFDVKLRIAGGTGPLPILQLDTDPHLELLPLAPDSPIDELETFMGNPRILQMKLRPETRVPVEIPLRFRLNRDTSIGQIAYPQLRLANVATSGRVFAISVAAGLSYQEQSNGQWNVLSPVEFMTQWGETSSEPLFAYVQSDQRFSFPGTSLGSLDVRPDPLSFDAKLSLVLKCGLESTKVRYQARMDNIAGQLFIHRLEVPANLRLKGIQIQDLTNGETIDSRWSIIEKSGIGKSEMGTREVSIFLSHPANGPHEVVLHGELVQLSNMPASIPRIVLMQATASPMEVEIFRDSNVLVHGNWLEIQGRPKEDRQDEGQQDSLLLSAENKDHVFVDAFLLAQHDQEVFEYQVTANDLRFSTECLTEIHEQEEGWSATFLVHLHVSSGVVDRLDIEVPETWIDPTVVGESAYLRSSRPGAFHQGLPQRIRRYELCLKHPLAQGEQINLKVTGRLEPETDQLARMPDIRAIGSSNPVRYLALPQMAQGKSLEWHRRGLQRTKLPPSLQQATQLGSSTQIFLVVQNGYLAEQRLFSQAAKRVKVSFAEMQGLVSPQGEWAGTALLVLHPGRSADCQLLLPPHSQLLHLSVGEQAVPWIRVGTSSWQIGLGPPSMPRMIKVGYTTSLNLQRGVVRLQTPQLLVGGKSLRPSISFWEVLVAGPQDVVGALASEVVTGKEIDELAYVRQGYLKCIQSLEELGSIAFQIPVWEAQQWFIPWQSRIEHSLVRWKQVEWSYRGRVLPNDGEQLPDQTGPFELSRGRNSARPESPSVTTRKDSFDLGRGTPVGLPQGALTKEGSSVWYALRSALGQQQAAAKNQFATMDSRQDSKEELAVERFSWTPRKYRYYASRSDGVLEIRLHPNGSRVVGRGIIAGLMVTFALLAIITESRIHSTCNQMAFYRLGTQTLNRFYVPHGILLVLGLVWWFCLSPSFVGFVVVAVTLLSMVRQWWLTRN